MVQLTVKKNIRSELDSMSVSRDFYDALDGEVQDILENAKRRAQENDRKTVQPRDL